MDLSPLSQFTVESGIKVLSNTSAFWKISHNTVSQIVNSSSEARFVIARKLSKVSREVLKESEADTIMFILYLLEFVTPQTASQLQVYIHSLQIRLEENMLT